VICGVQISTADKLEAGCWGMESREWQENFLFSKTFYFMGTEMLSRV